MDKNIILVGFMGCGKTTAGKIAAERLGYRFIDTDELIEKTEGMTIAELFSKKGEPYFRQRELETAKSLSKEGRTVIATGGGMVKNKEITELLRQNGRAVYIKASPEKIFLNLKHDNTRPLLEGGDKYSKIKWLMEEREKFYTAAADIIIDTDEKTAEETAESIAAVLEGTI